MYSDPGAWCKCLFKQAENWVIIERFDKEFKVEKCPFHKLSLLDFVRMTLTPIATTDVSQNKDIVTLFITKFNLTLWLHKISKFYSAMLT